MPLFLNLCFINDVWWDNKVCARSLSLSSGKVLPPLPPWDGFSAACFPASEIPESTGHSFPYFSLSRWWPLSLARAWGWAWGEQGWVCILCCIPGQSEWGCPCPRLVVLLHAWCKLHLSGDTPLAHPEPYTDASWHGIWRILWGCLSALGWVSRLWEAEMLAGPPLTLPLGQSIGQAADRWGNLSKVNLKSAPHWWQRLGCLAGSALAQSVSQESSPS